MAALITNIVGFAAAAVGTALMLPQVIKSLRTRRVDDVSFVMLVFYLLNCILWATYGFLIWALPVIICNLIATVIAVTQIVLKVRYTKRRRHAKA